MLFRSMLLLVIYLNIVVCEGFPRGVTINLTDEILKTHISLEFTS